MTDADRLLQKVLFANALFSAGSGSALLLVGPTLAAWLPGSVALLRAIGGALLLFGLAVGILAWQRHPDRLAVTAVSLADAAWVVGSGALLLFGADGLTSGARWVVAAVAIVVATFGLAQYLCLRAHRSAGGRDLGGRIVRSWASLETWVKMWLFWLNAVFLGALLFVDTPIGRWTVLAYLGAAPFLASMMIAQRGLTRLLGLAHLLPWAPLLAYLLLRVATGRLGPQLTSTSDPALFGYVCLLLLTLTVCLGFDFYDVVRWLRGERYVLGSDEAHRAGASGRTLE